MIPSLFFISLGKFTLMEDLIHLVCEGNHIKQVGYVSSEISVEESVSKARKSRVV